MKNDVFIFVRKKKLDGFKREYEAKQKSLTLSPCAQLNNFSSNDKQKIYSWLTVKKNREFLLSKAIDKCRKIENELQFSWND